VVETGDDISDCIDNECLVLVNHQSTGDVPVIMQALTGTNKQRLSRHVCWILDDMFKYANFGLPCHVHGDFFILQVQVLLAFVLSHLFEIQSVFYLFFCFNHYFIVLISCNKLSWLLFSLQALKYLCVVSYYEVWLILPVVTTCVVIYVKN